MKATLLLLPLLLAAPARAEGDAVLDKATGPVYIVAGGTKKPVPAKGGETLIYGDAVKTGLGGVAQLVMGERGAVLLHENTYMVLTGTPRRTVLDFARGEFLVGLRKKLLGGESFKTRTPAAVAAVRGTLFWGKSDKDKKTTYAGFGHRIEVTAKGKTVAVEAGQTVEVPFGQPPGAVTKHSIPVSYTQRFHVDGQLQGLEKLVALPPDSPNP